MKIKKSLKEKGQISVFLGISVMVIIGFLGFVINVGLFVKAKINLQNAVDAAAYSGAAVQARQLTNIAYLNFELRNTFKEWMFKYYVLGQKGIEATELGKINDGTLNPGGMNFRLRPFYKNPADPKFDSTAFDPFNVPSICIHYGSPHNICEIVSVPGLPRFDTVGLPSISKHHEEFLNSIVRTKAEDCSARSNINLGAAMLWAYGTAQNRIFTDVPQIASSRPGAWISAIELAIRIRNVEMIMNMYPQDRPICNNANAGNCTTMDTLLSQSSSLPLHERTIKAYFAGFRNLSGGHFKTVDDPFAGTFKLTELRPEPFIAEDDTLSGFLIPLERSEFRTKHYVDLQVYPINYVTFFTMFASKSGDFDASTAEEATCGSMKAALPVPGYILGFTKNHKVMTYYPVKGQAKFVGLFYPFAETDGVELTAYAAAKPMGGRIGPKLFRIEDNRRISARESTDKRYTANYTSTLNVAALTPTERDRIGGLPLPTTVNFWADQFANKTLGGTPSNASSSFYVVPNIIYDFTDAATLSNLNVQQIQQLNKATTFNQAYTVSVSTNERSGLYNKEQFEIFAQNQDASGILDSDEVLRSIFNARRATRYDALNYMIPIITDTPTTNPAGIEHNSYIVPAPGITGNGNADLQHYHLFGPLYGDDALYSEVTTIVSTVQNYLQQNASAFNTYLQALEDVRDTMVDQSKNFTRGANAYQDAANLIFNGDTAVTFPLGSGQCKKLSLSEKFATFLMADTGNRGCGIVPLQEKIGEYFEQQKNEVRGFENYYLAPYSVNANRPPADQLMTGFTPGPRQGAFPNGDVTRPGGGTLSSKRNFYSTKLFAMDKVLTSSANNFDVPALYIEGNSGSTFEADQVIEGDREVVNYLSPGQLSEFGTQLDF
jgi:hypothetical protein